MPHMRTASSFHCSQVIWTVSPHVTTSGPSGVNRSGWRERVLWGSDARRESVLGPRLKKALRGSDVKRSCKQEPLPAIT